MTIQLYKFWIRIYIQADASLNVKQAGTGPNRRHIQVSKIAKGLQNVKVLVNWGPFYEKKKKVSMPKKTGRGPFGLVRYRMLNGKPFWFSSLGQRVQFGVFLKFCRIFGVELFWSLRVSRSRERSKSAPYLRLKTEKGRPVGLCETPAGCKKFEKKLKGDPLET